MQLYLGFLLTVAVLGGTGLGRRLSARPWMVLIACAAFGSLFYMYRTTA